MTFLFAGEQSGDLLGGELLRELKKEDPSSLFFGVGGPRMRDEGLECLLPMEEFQVMGFRDVFKSLVRLCLNFRHIKRTILKQRPKKVILIDYADFNMRLAKALRKANYDGKIIHYVSPSVWAWRKKRAFSLAKHANLLLSILPFEKAYYEKTGLRVKYVGHPLVREIPFSPAKREPLIALFPGSRRGEIHNNLPLQLESIQPFLKNYRLAISVANPGVETEIKKILAKTKISCQFVPSHKRYSLMKECTLALATSGTVILELSLHATPTIVTYKLDWLNYVLGKYFFRISLPYYSLPNIILKKRLFPEFIEYRITTDEVQKAIESLLQQGEETAKECLEIRKELLEMETSKVAAKAILEI